MAVSPIEEVVEDIKAGKMVILVDDEDREMRVTSAWLLRRDPGGH